MEKNLLDILRIGIFYDGYYFYKVSNYYKYEHEKKARISISGLHEFIRSEVAVMTGADIRQCQIIDAHYFKGRSSAKELGEKVQSERIFEDILMRENIVSHYLPLRYGENNIAQEKGIDVWLALEAYELAIYKHFDILVLVAGDGDYVPLVRKLHTLGTQVMLICWDFSYHNENGDMVETKTSRQLLDEVFYPVQMYQRIEQNNSDYITKLFVPDRNLDKSQPLFNFRNESIIGSYAGDTKEYESSIFSINKNGFGFIKNEEINNIFFHYSTIANKDFSELQPGMRVKYTQEEDTERSKREGAPRYRACSVSIIE
ncbi:MAG: NYN domain-containing protein [Treponema sp.]|nr:NYN domain-containing protein [Treponema sp.]